MRGRWPGLLHLRHPRTYTEKLQHMMIAIDDFIPQAAYYTDKLTVRDYVESTVGADHLVPLLGVWDDPAAIDWDSLPARFVIKATHGSGFNIHVPARDQLDTGAAVRRLGQWMKRDYSLHARELQYRGITPRVLAEKWLDTSPQPLVGHKFHCFGGRPTFLVLEIGDPGEYTYEYVDVEWRPLSTRDLPPRPPQKPTPRPSNLEEMIGVAAALAAPFPFVRVDLYSVRGHVYFGEITFSPGAGKNRWRPPEWNRRFGDLIEI